MKNLRNAFFALTIVFAVTSCSKDDDTSTAKTNATITVKDATGTVSGISVFVYDQETWNMNGEDPFFALQEVVTDSNGKAKFSNLEYTLVFNEFNNNQQTFRFVAHYEDEGVEKTKVKAITFNKGDSKSDQIILD